LSAWSLRSSWRRTFRLSQEHQGPNNFSIIVQHCMFSFSLISVKIYHHPVKLEHLYYKDACCLMYPLKFCFQYLFLFSMFINAVMHWSFTKNYLGE
jgi:hypothetical protein